MTRAQQAMHIVVIDNYDSFTYNVVQALEMLGARCDVFKNDAITLAELEAIAPMGILISPGPCSPNEAGISLSVLERFAERTPILGVCLGHQALAQAFGGKVIRARQPMHGKTSAIQHDGRTIFKDVPNPFVATRYHSLVVERESLPRELEISAWTSEHEIMGLRHRELLLEGVQFHPESILTTHGARLFGAWLGCVCERAKS